jgi:uncharacterized protein (DUF1499 family)
MNTPNTHLMRYAVLLGFLLFFSCAGSPPDNLGVIDGQLAQVPSTPNAVSTQAPMDDKIHHIKPVPFKGTTEEFQKLVTDILESWEGATIVSAQGQYIYATFRSKIMGFVDDARVLLQSRRRPDPLPQRIPLRGRRSRGKPPEI